jgi:putative hydrolase of the HAD superfamily
MKRPKVIFLDAVGTLFGVRGSVGQVYSEIAQGFGVEVSAEVVNQSFFKAFAASKPLVFPGVDSEEIPDYEFEWWSAIALETFREAGVLDQFSDFASFFHQLYNHFGTAQPWFVYPDVSPALHRWQQMGIEMGVVSNFDSRIYAVLQALDLVQFFTSVTICSQVGAAKPDEKIFATSLQKHQCDAPDAWHIGDNLKEDYQGAKAAGLRAILVKRTEPLIGE